MKNFINKFFGSAKPDAGSSQLPNSGHTHSPSDGSEYSTRRQLIQVMLRNLLRHSGIPSEWLEFQTFSVTSRTKGSGIYLRLIVKHWDPRLMNYAFAFQNKLMNDIERFESNDLVWLHGISWHLEFGDSCPYQELPGKAYWLENTEKPEPAMSAALLASLMPDDLPAPVQTATSVASAPLVRPESTADDDIEARKHDLESLFAIRDKELSSENVMPVGYEKTQPSAL
jgi:hypothetical protein